MQIEVLNKSGNKTGRSVELPDDVFNIEPNDHCIYLSVKQYLAAQRQGNAKTKTRAEVHGSSKKLHKQKGTGGSRKGNIRNPLYKGGGAVNGPVPHLFGFKLNRKVKDLAKMSALSYKARANKIVIVEDIEMAAPKTSEYKQILDALRGDSRKTMMVLPDYNANLYLSSRNLPDTKTVVIWDMNTYDILHADVLVFPESVVEMLTAEEEETEVSTMPASKVAFTIPAEEASAENTATEANEETTQNNEEN